MMADVDVITMCDHCHQMIDPDVCHCGDRINEHTTGSGHGPIPAGCVCGYETPPKEEPDEVDLFRKQMLELAAPFITGLDTTTMSVQTLSRLLGFPDVPDDEKKES